jgi:hypothetical protein
MFEDNIIEMGEYFQFDPVKEPPVIIGGCVSYIPGFAHDFL